MNRQQLTGLINTKGWTVVDVLKYWGRSQDWYADNTTGGTDKEHIRLECMIYGLPDRDGVKDL